jgi:hypothetical protein
MSSMPGATELHDKACGGWTELVVNQIADADTARGASPV